MELPGGSGTGLPPAAAAAAAAAALARQGSIYSLTFDEFQNTLGGGGKDFGSMNMDELLRNIWTAEESHAMAAAAVASSSCQDAAASIQRQGSLTLPRTLSQKTVDEVWRDVMCFGATSGAGPAAPAPAPEQTQRQRTLREMTLEEFLVRAGVVREDMAPPAAPPPQALFPQSNVVAPMVPPLSLGTGLVPGVVGQGDVVAGGGVVTMASPVRPVVVDGLGKMDAGELSSLSPVPYVFNGGFGGRKGSSVEKVVERRQRRMIKNRESAARSRARKQAYIMELEAEISKLKQQNDELHQKQVEMIKKQKDEVLERINQQLGPKAKRFCLRRTLTGPW